MFLVNSCLSLFSVTYSHRYPFSRSYGVILPSSLTRVIPSVFVFSTRPPASVCGTGTFSLDSSFSRQRDIRIFLTLISVRVTTYPYSERSLLLTRLIAYSGNSISPICFSFCVTASLKRVRWYRNLYRLSISYSFRSRLRSRLTLGG